MGATHHGFFWKQRGLKTARRGTGGLQKKDVLRRLTAFPRLFGLFFTARTEPRESRIRGKGRPEREGSFHVYIRNQNEERVLQNGQREK